MEQLKRLILSFEASAERHDGTVVPFSLRVYEPELDEKLGDFCFIECPFIRQRPFRIFGVDQEQACELSVKFINWMLEYDVVRLMDAQGQEVHIPRISWPGPG